MWAGTFQAIGDGLVKTTFMLEVTFGEDVSVADSVGSIEAFVAQGTADTYYLLTGTYDANGVITGKVNYGEFTGGDSDAPKDSRATNGILTGLIGQDGAVGAFTSTATGATGYSGGFVASPITPDGEFNVTFADWTRSFDPALGTEPTTGTPQSEFLQATGGTLATGNLTDSSGSPIVITTLNLSTARFRNSPLGGDAGNGVAFYQGYSGSDGAGYAGIFDTTDLGGPITAEDARAEWRGQFQVVGSGDINTDFTLEVTFGGESNAAGRVEAFVARPVATDFYHYLSGTFSNTGVIKGTNSFGVYTGGDRNNPFGTPLDGVLTGLIGQDGAVGTFYANDGAYAGGFVARPTVFANYQSWEDSLDTFPQAAGTHTGKPPSQFLQGGKTQIDPGTVKFSGGSVTVHTLTMAGNPTRFTGSEDPEKAKNGVSFFQGHTGFKGNTSFSPRLFAGMLSGTNMGRTLVPYTSGNPTAMWAGKIRWVGFLGGVTFPGNNADARDLNLEVNFQDRTLEAFVKMDIRNHHLLLKAGYNELGQFTDGTVKYGIFENSQGEADRDAVRTADGLQSDRQFDKPFDGTLTGIIGSGGAVGVFINDKVDGDYGFAGGFVAAPDTANLADWTASFAAGGFNEAQDDLFAAGTDVTTIDSGTGRFIQWSDTRDFTPGGGLGKFSADTDILLLNGEANNGIGFRYSLSRTVTNGRGFAGLLSATDMGAPLDDTSKNTIWTGKIVGIAGAVALAETELRLKVTYNASFTNGVGTIQSIANQTNYTYAERAETVGAVNVRASNFRNTFNFDGGFDANGVITGTIAHTLSAGGPTASQNGVFSGLIGVRGAVGVFKNDDTIKTSPFVGGFVVVAPE